jgi:hypothetical protein
MPESGMTRMAYFSGADQGLPHQTVAKGRRLSNVLWYTSEVLAFMPAPMRAVR